jgi:hypothetical protein
MPSHKHKLKYAYTAGRKTPMCLYNTEHIRIDSVMKGENLIHRTPVQSPVLIRKAIPGLHICNLTTAAMVWMQFVP